MRGRTGRRVSDAYTSAIEWALMKPLSRPAATRRTAGKAWAWWGWLRDEAATRTVVSKKISITPSERIDSAPRAPRPARAPSWRRAQPLRRGPRVRPPGPSRVAARQGATERRPVVPLLPVRRQAQAPAVPGDVWER